MPHTTPAIRTGPAPTRRRAGRRSGHRALHAAAALMMVAGVGVLFAGLAQASTLNGVATVASPGTTTALTSGASDTQFTIVLPAGAACSGDTANGGYHIYSYLVPAGTALSTVTFNQHPSTGLGLFDETGSYYGPVNTAVNTGQVPTLPNDFEWGAFIAAHPSDLATLLYTGGTSGVWEGGIACATTAGVVSDNWNTQFTFTKSNSDANGFVWTDGQATTTTTTTTTIPSTTTTTSGGATTTTTTSGGGATTTTTQASGDGTTTTAPPVVAANGSDGGSSSSGGTGTSGSDGSTSASGKLAYTGFPVVKGIGRGLLGIGLGLMLLGWGYRARMRSLQTAGDTTR